MVSSGDCGELGLSIRIDQWIVDVGVNVGPKGIVNMGPVRWTVDVGPTWTEKLTFGQTISIMVYVVLNCFACSISVFGAC